MHEHDSSDTLALERVLFFSDAVFAIAITLLVIEIKVPSLGHHVKERDLLIALANLIPLIVGFIISFFLIGQTWVEHHKIGRQLQSFDLGLLWKNLFLLFFVAFMPFATALLSEYFQTRIADVVYALTFAGLGFAKMAFWRHALSRGHVRNPEAAEAVSISRRVWATPIAALIVAIAAFLGAGWAPVGFVLIPVIAKTLDRKPAPVVTEA